MITILVARGCRPFALPRPGLFEETICEGFRIKAVAVKENWTDSEVTVREFAVQIHEKDKKRIFLEGYFLDVRVCVCACRGVGVWVRCCMCIYVSEYDIYISGTQGASAGGKLAPCGLLSVRPGMPAHFVDVHVYVDVHVDVHVYVYVYVYMYVYVRVQRESV